MVGGWSVRNFESRPDESSVSSWWSRRRWVATVPGSSGSSVGWTWRYGLEESARTGRVAWFDSVCVVSVLWGGMAGSWCFVDVINHCRFRGDVTTRPGWGRTRESPRAVDRPGRSRRCRSRASRSLRSSVASVRGFAAHHRGLPPVGLAFAPCGACVARAGSTARPLSVPPRGVWSGYAEFG